MKLKVGDAFVAFSKNSFSVEFLRSWKVYLYTTAHDRLEIAKLYLKTHILVKEQAGRSKLLRELYEG